MSQQPDAFVLSALFIRDLELLHPKPLQLVWKGKVLFYASHHTSGWGGPFCVRNRNRLNQVKEAGTGIPLPRQSQKRTCWRTPHRRTQTIPEGLSCEMLYAVTRAEPGNTQLHGAWLQRSVCKGLLSISSSMTPCTLLWQLLETVMSVYPFGLFRNRRCCALLDFFNALLNLDHKLVRHW